MERTPVVVKSPPGGKVSCKEKLARLSSSFLFLFPGEDLLAPSGTSITLLHTLAASQ